MKVLVIGSGGREHAVCWKLREDNRVSELFCAPGNGGISKIATCVQISATDLDGITAFSKENKIDMVVVTPDDPLALGMVDKLNAEGIRAFGPNKAAARIESSKAFSKMLMKKYNIPTAAFEVFSDSNDAKAYLKKARFPLVIKADGLALGKGVIICNTIDEAFSAIDSMMINGAFGVSGSTVVIEEFLKGREVSVLAFADGKTIVPMPPSRDHKRALDNDLGLNTGGMGAFSPVVDFSEELTKKALDTIFLPTLRALNEEGCPFSGVLYFGLMVDGTDIKVLEYNARFGDPETQCLLPRLRTSLVDIFNAVIDKRLDTLKIEYSSKPCVCVVLASGGYPEKYDKGKKITIDEVDDSITIFHAGTALDSEGNYITNGGRVLGITAMGETLQEAKNTVYKNIERIHFDKMHYRKDICKVKL